MTHFDDNDELNNYSPAKFKADLSAKSSEPQLHLPDDSSSKMLEDSIVSYSLNMMDWLQAIQTGDLNPTVPSAKQSIEQPTSFLKMMRNIGVSFTGRKFVEITEIEITCEHSPLFWNGNIDSLRAGVKHLEATTLLSGWVLGRTNSIRAVRLSMADTKIIDTPLNIPRPDVRKVYSFATATDVCGFSLTFDFNMLPNLSAQGLIQLQAIFENAQIVPFAFIKFQKYSGIFAKF